MSEVAKIPETSSDGFVDELQPGTPLLHGQYKITRYLNAGGFGITYLATDSLNRQVVIKECFPGSFCRRSRLLVQPRSRSHAGELRSIVRLFTREAEALAKLQHPNIVSVHQVFEDNNTAYMAIDFIEGHDLLAITKTKVMILRPDQIRSILRKSLDAIGCVHDAGLLHRDISPDNIIVNGDMEPVLIDFGAAREQATKATQALSAMRVVKDGYSPQEFYVAGSVQGHESDLYSLAATFYYVITRQIPPDSQKRLAAHVAGEPDPYVPLSRLTQDYDAAFCDAIDQALAVLPQNRIKYASEWLEMLDGKRPAGRKAQKKTARAGGGAKTSRKVGTIFAASLAGAALAGGAAVFLNDGFDMTASLVTPGDVALAEPTPPPAPEVPPAPVETAVVLPEFAPEDATEGPLASMPVRFEENGVSAEWRVALPFTLGDGVEIAEVEGLNWLAPGLSLRELNGSEISSASDVDAIVRQAATQDDGTVAKLKLVAAAADGSMVYGSLSAPVVFETVLPDGTRLGTRFESGAWETRVTQVSSGSALQPGDIIVGVLDTTATPVGGDGIARLLSDEIGNGRKEARLAVRRDGTMWLTRVALVPQTNE